MRRFYHFRREKRSVRRSQNPLRAPAQSTAFSNRRFNRRAAQNRSSSDSAQARLQSRAASAAKLSMYKASCAGFTTLLRLASTLRPLNSRASAQTYFKKHRRTKPLSIRFHASPATLSHPAPSAGFAAFLRFGINPRAPLSSRASARTPFKKRCRTKPLSIRFHASPATLCHPAHPAPDSPHSSASASNPAPRSFARTPFKKHRRTKPLSIRFRATPSAKPRCQCRQVIHVQSILRRIHHAPSLRHQTLRPLNSRASARTYFKKHRRTKLLSIRFRASPATLCHPAHPAPDSPHSFALHQIPQSPYNARQSTPALPHARGITGNLSTGGQKNRRTRLDAAVDVTFQAAIRPARRST